MWYRHLAVFVAFVSVACGGSSPTAPSPSPAASGPIPVTLRVQPAGDPPNATGRVYTMITAQSTVAMTAVATMSDGSSRDVTSEAVWTSSNANVASVTAAGVVTVNRRVAGSAVIAAEYRAVRGSFNFGVM